MRSGRGTGTRAALAGAGLVLVAGCTTGGGGGGPVAAPAPSSVVAPAPAGTPAASSPPAGALPRPDHVLVVVFENEDAQDVLGSRDAPYLTALAASGATFGDAHGETHPSQPNYLALFSGSTQGVTDDHCLTQLPGPDLGSQLLGAGLGFAGYSEGLPEAGFTGCSAGRYARKHNPWVDFADLPPSVNQPLTALPGDYGRLPTVSFVIPDLCNDMHDCGVAAGDRWARQTLDPYVTWARGHNSLLLVTFDEDGGTKANHIATFLVGAGVRVTTSDRRIDHYDLLRTLEDMYGLPPLGKAADASAVTDVWATPG